MLLEIKVQREDASVEARLESVSLRHLPLAVDNSEGDVFVGRSAREPNRQRISRAIWLEIELRSLCAI